MKKVIIIGPSGAGKSTFARALRDKTNLPLYYLDMIWHKSDKTTVSREEFDSKLAEILIKEEWIIDGNYARTLETRLQYCDTVVMLDYPIDVCLKGVESRIGKKREDMPWIEEEFDPEFKQWILNFRSNIMPKVYYLLDKYKENKQIYVFSSRNQANDFLARK